MSLPFGSGDSNIIPLPRESSDDQGGKHHARKADIQPNSKRPGRGGNDSCMRCRRHKNNVKNPCDIDPKDPHGACVPCVRSGLAHTCGGKLPPPTRLARKRALLARQDSLLMKSLASETEEGVFTGEARRVGNSDGIGLTRLDSPSAARIPEPIGFVDRFAALDNIDLNSDRPKHGLDQRSLISDPNVQIEAEASTLSFPFGVQKSVMHLDPSSSGSSPCGLQEFCISPSDVSLIHSILAPKLLFLDQSTINTALHQTVAHLTMLNDNEATKILKDLGEDLDADGKLSDKR